jgi:hypothetical protein
MMTKLMGMTTRRGSERLTSGRPVLLTMLSCQLFLRLSFQSCRAADLVMMSMRAWCSLMVSALRRYGWSSTHSTLNTFEQGFYSPRLGGGPAVHAAVNLQAIEMMVRCLMRRIARSSLFSSRDFRWSVYGVIGTVCSIMGIHVGN